MKYLSLLILLACQLIYSQQPLKVMIDTIIVTKEDSINTYQIKYSIKNITPQKLSFFLKPESIIANVRASLSTKPFYKVYKDKELLNATIFQNEKKKDPNFLNKMLEKAQIELDNMIKGSKSSNPTNDSNPFFDIQNKELMSNVMSIEPNETKTYNLTLYWNKKRYIKEHDLEFYIDEKSKYKFEISFTLYKTEFKENLTSEQFKYIDSNPYFIKGNFSSNAVNISFD